MAKLDLESIIKKGAEEAVNMPVFGGKSIVEWAAIGMKAPRWISADKRPPKQGRYLVWGLTRVIPDHNDEPNQYWQTRIAQWFEGIGWECKVKFWQMLPEPPEDEGNE